ncbi:MAG: N-acetyltransferase [Actinomycetota bacterium]|nr:N-acetyltransferase [Actinomycetota bacterium]
MDLDRSQKGYFAHPTAVIEEGARIGSGTKVWHQCHLREGSSVGASCILGFAVYVDAEVVVGDRCKIQNHVSLYRGVVLEEEVFVGPSVVFTNDMYPRASSTDWEVIPTRVGRGASLGANSTIVCGLTIGAHSMVGAGSVVTRDVPAHALVMGSPARVGGWVCTCGMLLARAGESLPATCPRCGRETSDVPAT